MSATAQTVSGRALAIGPANWLALAAFAASAALLIALTAPVTFILDDWAFLAFRRDLSADAVLGPHNEHIVVGPILAYKLLWELFGIDSPRPFQLVAIAGFLAAAGVLYAYLRRRVDAWLALAAILVALFLGPAWENLLWSFQIGMLASMAAGLGMVLALERGDRGGDLAACGLLSISLAFSSLGLAFAAGAAVAVATSPGRVRRAWLVVAPLAAFGAWWLGWGYLADSHITFDNVLGAPGYVFDGLASSVASALGLASPHDGLHVDPLTVGRPLAAVLLALAAWRLVRLGRVPRGLLVMVAVALAFWGLAALNAVDARPPTNSRYQFVGVFLTIAIAAELVRGIRLSRAALMTTFAVVAAVVVSNAIYLRDAQRVLVETSDLVRADLGAVEIARDSVDPNLALSADIAGTIAIPITAGAYLATADALGSPADTPAEIATAPAFAREAADKVLSRALGLTFTPLPQPPRGLNCTGPAAGGGATVVTVPPGGAVVRAGRGAAAHLRLRRFSDRFPIEVGRLGPGRAAELAIPLDRADRPWELRASPGARIAVCERPR